MQKRNSFIISRSFRNYFTTVIILMAAEQLCSIIDMILVGNFVSAEAFSALDLALPVESIFRGISLLFAGGAGLIASRHIGNQEFDDANRVVSISIIVSFAVSLLVATGMMLCFGSLSSALCPDESLIGYVEDYLRVYIPSFVVLTLFNAVSTAMNVDGKPFVLMVISVSACVLDIIADVVFMKFLGLGIAGQAYATLISYLVPLVVCSIYMAGSKFGFKLMLGGWKKKMFTRILKAGVSYCVPFLISALMLCFVNALMLDHFGAEGLYVWSVGYQVLSIGLLLLDCIGGTIIVTMGSMLVGSHDNEGLTTLIRDCFKTMGLAVAAVLLAVMFFPKAIISVFGGADAVNMQSAVTSLRMLAIFLIPFCAQSLKVYVSLALFRTHFAALMFTLFFTFVLAVMVIWINIAPETGFVAFPAAGFAFLAFDYFLSRYLSKHKFAECSPYFLLPTFDESRTLSISVPYTQEGRDTALNDLSKFLEGFNYEPSVLMGINLCCEEVMFNIQESNEGHNADYFYDLVIQDEDDAVKVTFKDAGRPFNPIRRFEKSAAQAYLEGEEMDLSLQIVNKMCKELNYNYMYGQNVIYMTFRK